VLLGLSILALRGIDLGESVERVADVHVGRAEYFVLDSECPLAKKLSLVYANRCQAAEFWLPPDGGDPVSFLRSEARAPVWPDSFVEEANLTQNIFLLRKALGEESSGSRYIETVPRRGYRFVASVREAKPATVTETKPAFPRYRMRLILLVSALLFGLLAAVYWQVAGKTERGGRGAGIRSIAVLPFANVSSDQANEYFSDGLTDELINVLAKVEGLQVAARGSVFAKGRPRTFEQSANA
jgi:Transcriptional regulatory protein, C terminal